MRRWQTRDLVSTRRSRWYYIDGVDDARLQARLHSMRDGNGYYEHMLIEDVGHLLPFGRGLDEGFTAKLTGADATRVEDLVCEALPTQYDRTYLAEALREFLQHTAQLLVGFAPAVYEIDYLLDPSAQEAAPVAFRLEPIQPGSLDRVHRTPVQYVPRSMAEKVHKNGLGYVELDPDRLVTFGLPDALERDVRRAVRFLVAASDQQRVEFELVEQAMKERTDYDPTEHHRTIGQLLLLATRQIGWNARGLYSDHVLDPYTVWRQLQFKRFKIQLRDTILEQLNRALEHVGKQMGFDVQLVLADVPSLADIDAAEAALRLGTQSLSELLTVSR